MLKQRDKEGKDPVKILSEIVKELKRTYSVIQGKEINICLVSTPWQELFIHYLM